MGSVVIWKDNDAERLGDAGWMGGGRIIKGNYDTGIAV